MNHIDFNTPKHVYFMGIGGISMSGLAQILHAKGFKISGSDMKASELTDRLINEGINIFIGQKASNITNDIDLVVYTAAIHPDNPEYSAAKEKNIPMIPRAELLGEIMSNYNVAVGVSGTHGKTTTTSMLTEVMVEAGLDPTVSVGGILPSIGGNLRLGESSNFITEACEYTNSFLSFFPTIGIILNIEEDHLDFFKDLDDIRHSFKSYASLLPEDGLLVINSDINDYQYITSQVKCPVVTVGTNLSSDYSAKDISYDDKGCCQYTLLHKGGEIGIINLSVPGIHNVYNSLAAIATGLHLGISLENIRQGLLNFTGTDRRFQKKGEINGFTIIDDYAHHPAEIRATLNSAKNYPHKRIVCVFQPHTYTRTQAFLDDFANALSGADLVILADIYAAREKNTIGVSSVQIKDRLDALNTPCIYEPDFSKIEQYITDNCREGDLVITMGAGNIVEVGEHILNR